MIAARGYFSVAATMKICSSLVVAAVVMPLLVVVGDERAVIGADNANISVRGDFGGLWVAGEDRKRVKVAFLGGCDHAEHWRAYRDGVGLV